MAIKFGSKFKSFVGVKITTQTQVVERPAALAWVTKPGNLGTFPAASNFSYQILANDPYDAIEYFDVVGGTLPPGITLNPFSGELDGWLPEVDGIETFNFSLRVRTSDNRHLYGDFSLTVEYTELFVEWITPPGLLGEYDIGAPVTKPLEAKANK